MNRIRILPDAVKKKIAAGEVVEGPFSVVKELVENAIDAGATAIDVEVADGGLKKILVRDNGCGIPADDCALAVREYATSKIADIQDIEQVASYGFRGEALSSISSISRMTIATRCEGEELGARMVATDGDIEQAAFAGPVGTVVTVENLFYNVPARKKFLKARGTEQRYIRETLLGIALALPGISFALTVDDKRQLALPAAESHVRRIRDIYGEEAALNLIPAELSDIKASVRGYLSNPSFMRSSRSMQLLYVNGRPIEYPYLGFILSRAYEGIAGAGKHPAAIIFLEIDPSLVDVNVHPAKREVRFFDQKYVDSLITGLARKALGSGAHDLRAESLVAEGVRDTGAIAPQRSGNDDATLMPRSPQGERHDAAGVTGLFASNKSGDGVPSVQSIIRDARQLYRAQGSDSYRLLGVVFATYLVAEDAESLLIIDFHAAHERMLFDRLMANASPPSVQAFAFPEVIELSVNEYAIVREHADAVREIGFDIDLMSDNTVSVQGVPDIARGIDARACIADFVESVRSEGRARADIRRTLYERVACHAAKRANDELTLDDMHALVSAVLSGRHETRCPHGRPYLYRLGRKELEGLFKRS